jgi:hypothetical protein
MAQFHQQLCFSLKPSEGAMALVFFDSDDFFCLQVSGTIDSAKAATALHGFNLVLPLQDSPAPQQLPLWHPAFGAIVGGLRIVRTALWVRAKLSLHRCCLYSQSPSAKQFCPYFVSMRQQLLPTLRAKLCRQRIHVPKKKMRLFG